MLRDIVGLMSVTLFAAALPSCGESSGTTEGCKSDLECRGERICVNGACVDPGPGPQPGLDASAYDTNQASNLCVNSGGTLASGGACVLSCTYEAASPRGDFNGNCTPFGYACDRYLKLCIPPVSCTIDTDCPTGWRCAPKQQKCALPCASDADCPPSPAECLLEDTYNVYGATNICVVLQA